MITNPGINRFSRNLVLFSLAALLLAAILYFILPPKFFSPAVPFLVLFFFAVTLLNFRILARSAGKKFIRFINYYILSTAIKLVLFIAVMTTYILLNRRDALPFGIWFFSLYLTFTVYEVAGLVGFFKTFKE